MDSTIYSCALLLHLLGAMAFVSGAVVAGVAFEVARRRAQPREIATLLSLSRIGVTLVGLGTVLLGIFGLWLVHLGRWGYGSGWVDGASGLFVLALVLGGLGGQRPKQARHVAGRLAAEPGAGERTPEGSAAQEELRRLLDDPVSRLANYASLAAVLGVLVLMVFK